ncbi:MAG: phosphoadenylyl-sulfate reductase [Thiohalomonadales bacterium]
MSLLKKTNRMIRILEHVDRDYAPATFACSFSIEDMIIADTIFNRFPNIEVFTIDTGRIHEETHEFIQQVRSHYQQEIKSYFPDPNNIEHLVNSFGPNGFYKSIELRKTCCDSRKLMPLNRALINKRAWVSGLRRQQSELRSSVSPLQWDSAHQIPKFNPLYDWSTAQAWEYIHNNAIPYNSLYDRGYTSIGCAPCTKIVLNNDANDLMAGRWWWERDAQKECGIHEIPEKVS